MMRRVGRPEGRPLHSVKTRRQPTERPEGVPYIPSKHGVNPRNGLKAVPYTRRMNRPLRFGCRGRSLDRPVGLTRDYDPPEATLVSLNFSTPRFETRSPSR